MERLKRLQELSIYEYEKQFLYEPLGRHELLKERIDDVIKTYKPGVVVKAGLGNSRIILDLIKDHQGIVLVVVEPSLKVIENFIKDNNDVPGAKDIRFINGEFKQFPVDYYAADFIISIDNLNVQETAPVIDEFKRALEFDGHLFLADIVLEDDDLDGVYDDYIKMIFPVHNDYYLHDDMKTLMDLKEFSFIKGKMDYIDYDLDEISTHLKELYGEPESDPQEFLDANSEAFVENYKLNERKITVPYYSGLFLRRKIKVEI